MNGDRVYELYHGDLANTGTRRCRERIHWICSQVEGKRVLDIGCSQGMVCLLLGREGFECTGVDIESAAIEFATARRDEEEEAVRRRIDFRLASALELPFPDGSFDTVVLGEILEHLSRPDRVLAEARRVLRDDGTAIVTVPYGLKPHPDHKRVFYPTSLLDTLEPHFRTATVQTLEHYITYRGVKQSAWAGDGAALGLSEASRIELQRDVERRCLSKETALFGRNNQLHRKIQALTEEVERLRVAEPAAARPAGVEARYEEELRRQRESYEQRLAARDEEIRRMVEEADRRSEARLAEQAEAHRAALAERDRAMEDTRVLHEIALEAKEREHRMALARQEESWRRRFDEREEAIAHDRASVEEALGSELRELGKRLSALRQQSEKRSKGDAKGRKEGKERERQAVAERVRELVTATVPEGATVAVISRGDEELLRLGGRRGLHFPQGPGGVYAGHHPANDAEAVERLEGARAAGAEYLVLPCSAYWWLEHYPTFRSHLESRYPPTAFGERSCLIFDLQGDEGDRPSDDVADQSAPSTPNPSYMPPIRSRLLGIDLRLQSRPEGNGGGGMAVLARAGQPHGWNGNGNGNGNGSGNGNGNGNGKANGNGFAAAESRNGNGSGGVATESRSANGAPAIQSTNGNGAVPVAAAPVARPIIARPAPAPAAGATAASIAIPPAPTPAATPVVPAPTEAPDHTGRTRMVGVLDEFTTECLRPECRLITCRPDNWQQVLEREAPEAVFVESAWRGNSGSWQYRVAKYPNNVGDELNEMLGWARQHGIPSIFWNKEDPVHFERFIERAGHFEYVFTTDVNCVPAYRERLGHDRVFPLPFAAQPAIHHPVLDAPRDGRVCFAGTYYADRHAERRGDMDHILRPAIDFGLDIYDRQHGLAGKQAELYRFPDIYQPHIRGRLDYEEMVRAYKRYRVFLNVNSVKNSSTMFSRRVFELLASGTPVVSTYSRGIAEMFGEDLVLFTETEDDTRRHLDRLLSDDDAWERTSLRGIRTVMTDHTYAERMRHVFGKVGIDSPAGALPRLGIIASVRDAGKLDRLRETLRRQVVRPADLIVLSDDALPTEALERLRNGLEGVTVHALDPAGRDLLDRCLRASGAEYFGFLDLRDHYGPGYLQDLALATLYSGAPILGKSAFRRRVGRDGVAESEGGGQYGYVESAPTATLLVRRDTLSDALLHECLESRAIRRPSPYILSIDRANYLQDAWAFGEGLPGRDLLDRVEV